MTKLGSQLKSDVGKKELWK